MSEAGIARPDPMADCDRPRPAEEDVIDDMEDGDPVLSAFAGAGAWFLAHDDAANGVLVPMSYNPEMASIAGSRCGSRFALHTAGHGFTSWGINAGLIFSNSVVEADGGISAAPVDASAFAGVRFWARRGEGADPALVFGVMDIETLPTAGRCLDDADGGDQRCYNYFSTTVLLTPDWVEYAVPFSALRQDPTWGHRVPTPAVEGLYGLAFQFRASEQPFDVWIDDVAWLRQP